MARCDGQNKKRIDASDTHMLSRPHVDCFYRNVSNSGDIVTSKGLLQHLVDLGEFIIRNYGWVVGLGSKQDRGVAVILVEKGLAPRKPRH